MHSGYHLFPFPVPPNQRPARAHRLPQPRQHAPAQVNTRSLENTSALGAVRSLAVPCSTIAYYDLLPSLLPSFPPSFLPPSLPSVLSSFFPSFLPSLRPSFLLSLPPSLLPSGLPFLPPSFLPSLPPSVRPSFFLPSLRPSFPPSLLPSFLRRPQRSPLVLELSDKPCGCREARRCQFQKSA